MQKLFLKSCVIILLLISSSCYAAVLGDGTDDFINIPAGPNIASTHAFSVSLWIKAANDGDRAFFYQDNSPLIIFGVGQQAGKGTAGKATMLLRRDAFQGLQGFSGTTTITGGGEYHIGFVKYDAGGGNMRYELYVNGESESSGIWTNGGAIDVSGGIGHTIFYSSTASVEGTITEVAFWHHTDNVQLTDDEMRLLGKSKVKRMPLQIQPDDLYFYLPMDDCADGVSCDGKAFIDLSGKGRDGIGDDGANNTGLTGAAEEVLSYPPN